MTPRSALPAVVVVALALVACSRDEEDASESTVASSIVSSSTPTTEPSATTEPSTTTEPSSTSSTSSTVTSETSDPSTTTAVTTTTAPVTSGAAASTTAAPATTAAPVTTAAPAATMPPPTVATPTTAPSRPAPPAPTPAPTTAFAIVDSDLLELDATTGATRRTIVELFEGDGVFRGNLVLTRDRGSAYYSEGYEDSWFDCGSSVGSVGRVDLTTGATETIAAGWSPSLSPSGDRLAYLTSSLCLPDPEQPDIWVLTPADRVVVLDLATSARIEITTATSPSAYDDPAALDWVRFHPNGDLLVATANGNVHRVASDAPTTAQNGPVVARGGLMFPVAAYERTLVVLQIGDEGATTVAEIELGSGATSTLWESELFVVAAGDPAGHVLVIDSDALENVNDGDLTVLALDQFVTDVAW